MRTAAFLLISLLFGSCANYVQSLHNQINREENAGRPMQVRQAMPLTGQQVAPTPQNPFNRALDKRPIQNPKTLGGYPVAAAPRAQQPAQANSEYSAYRATAEDFRDNSSDGSLWSGENTENFLFVTNNIKRRGDIVIIEVLSKLKNNITEELKRNFPEKKSSSANNASAANENEQADVAASPAGQEDPDAKTVHDKISTQVVESINKDYLLVRGRKEVIFRKAKRYIEIQALVSRKDITDNDTVASDLVLEPIIRVLRY